MTVGHVVTQGPFVDLNHVLIQRFNVELPNFPCFSPDAQSYQVLQFQPEGKVKVDTNFVGRALRDLASSQSKEFLRLARSLNVDIAIAPEYSCPIETLQESLVAGEGPSKEKLWILGVEAITVDQLHAFRNALGANAHVLYEQEIEAQQGDFVDPVFLVFKALDARGTEKLMVVIQFKTTAMGDRKRFELDHLKKGSQIYVFNKERADRIRLAVFICSDALSNHFGNENALREIYGRSLLIHIQMNPNPRHPTFRRYRELLFTRFAPDSTELICANWSKNVEAVPANAFKWEHLGGSAVYMKSNHIEGDDARVAANHRLGLYPTFSEELRTYSFFFNFLPGVFHFRTSKSCQDNATPPQARRNGPEMLGRYEWAQGTGAWTGQQHPVEDGFVALCGEVNQTRLEFLHSPVYEPLNAERLLNLSAGKSTSVDSSELREMPSFRIRADEFIARLTFAQEKEHAATLARRGYLTSICHLLDIVSTRTIAPKWIELFDASSTLAFRGDRPLRNLHFGDRSATVIYAGELHTEDELMKMYADIKKTLYSTDQDTEMLAIWFRSGADYRLLFDTLRPKFNRDRAELPTDIDREPDNA